MKLDGIEIYNAYWANEFEGEPVAQQQERTVTGALINFERAQPAGQPMTIRGAWVKRSVLKQLQAKRATANIVCTVELDDARKYSVIFDRSKASLEATQIDGAPAAPNDNDQYEIVLNLQIIEDITPIGGA